MKEPINLASVRGNRDGDSLTSELLNAARYSIRQNDFAEAERALRNAERIGNTPETLGVRALLERSQLVAAERAGIDPFMRPEQVYAVTGLGRSAVWARVSKGQFPAPVSLGGHRVAWRQSAIRQWQDARPVVARASQAVA